MIYYLQRLFTVESKFTANKLVYLKNNSFAVNIVNLWFTVNDT